MATPSKGASALAVFQFNTTPIRTVEKNGVVWFVANDIAKALDYAEAKDMTRVLDDDEKGRHIVPTLSADAVGRGGGDQTVTVINESGLYHALLKSRKPEAQPFRKWVTNEVLPAIRKNGRYAFPAPAARRASKPINNAQLWMLCDLVTLRLDRAGLSATGMEAYNAIRNRFGIVDMRELTTDQLPEALLLAARAPLQGEYLPRESNPDVVVGLRRDEAHNLAALLRMLPRYRPVMMQAEQVLRMAQSPLSAIVRDAWAEPHLCVSLLDDLARRCMAATQNQN